MNRISRRGVTPLAYPGIAVLPSERRLACAAKLWLLCYPTVLVDADVSLSTTTPCEHENTTVAAKMSLFGESYLTGTASHALAGSL
jgi:hypothetical protein